MTHKLTGLFKNSSFVFLLAMAAAMLFSGGASLTEPALVPVLAVIMTVSILDVSAKIFLDIRKIILPILIALLLNYVLLSSTFIGLSSIITDNPDIRNGFVLSAAVPPAVAVIPLTYLLGGNTKLSLVGNVGAYIAGLGITPLISLLFLGADLIDPARLLIVLAELIVAPIVASRILRRVNLARVVESWRGPVVNWGFFLVIYTIVGLNRDTFLHEPDMVIVSAVVAFAGTFILAAVINRIGRLFGLEKADRISLMLFSARKNDGLAGAVALIFFSPRVAMPVAIVSAFSVIHSIWLFWWVKRMK